jgi:hypothetical protein
MGADAAGRALFERAVTIHREDCAAVTGPGGFAASDADAPVEASAAPEALVAYRIGAAAVFDTLRCLIGQISGLLILVEVSGRRDILDLPDLGLARDRLATAEAAIAGLSAPGALAAHRARLTRAQRLVGESLLAFARCGAAAGGAAALSEASARIATAYQVLKAASDVEAGLTMVDFRQACCTCASTPTRVAGGRP